MRAPPLYLTPASTWSVFQEIRGHVKRCFSKIRLCAQRLLVLSEGCSADFLQTFQSLRVLGGTESSGEGLEFAPLTNLVSSRIPFLCNMWTSKLFPVKGQRAHIFSSVSHLVSCCNFFTLPFWQESSHRQCVNEWA